MANKLWQHPWVVGVCNIALIFVLYTLQRLFFYWVNMDLFPDVTFRHLLELLAGGMRFDVTALFYLNSVYMLLMWLPLPWTWRTNRTYQNIAKWFYWVPNIVGILVNSVDTVYVRFSDRRTTTAFFSEFENDDNLASIFFTAMVQYWYVTLFTVALIAILILLTRQPKPLSTFNSQFSILNSQLSTLTYYLTETVLFCISVYFVVIGIRSGFGAYTRPITLSNALQYTNQPRETMIVLNTPFSLMRSTDSQTYQHVYYFEQDALAGHMTPEHKASATTAIGEQPMNVIIFILESFSKEYIGFFHHDWHDGTYQGYTPFLDSLLAQSVTYTHSFASGRKSIDAMPSILSSIPMLIEPYIVTPYATNAISSVAACLNEKGYTTSFFHGAPNGSMGFQAFARSAGFDRYYGMNEYDGPDAFDGTWAIWDEEFLQYMGRTLSQTQEPFLGAVFTASSHHPFRVPERYEGVFPQGQIPIHQCIGYTDHALHEFFAYAQQQPWYDHTLFVLTADHTNQLIEPESLTDRGVYEVPILFYYPGITPKVDSATVISQTDIMPSVLAAVGYDAPYFAFGEDAFTQPKAHNYAICYNNPVYQLIADSILIQFDGQHVTQPAQSVPTEMVDYLKAYIQQYINRMIDNRLTCPSE
ncbi:MAG: sulfatase-like hydrolase/transferase [Paludibacteraceae bacterium]|nr:sulfatase-like hydrolase/transferase [Paludibacteraceae bacterium]